MEPITVAAGSWQLVHILEPWIWWVKSGAALICFLLMFFRFWSVSMPMRVACYVSMIGMIAIFLSSLDTRLNALGPLGDIVFWPAYMMYRLFDVVRRWPALRAKMAMQPISPERVLFSYLTKGRVPEAVIRRHRSSSPYVQR